MTVTNGIRHIQDPPEPIAIVSAACRLPGHVNSPHKLWELLQSGGTAVSNEVPKSRFSSEGHFDGSGRPGTMKALSGMFIEDIDPAAFDASFFNITRADAISMEPQQRQLLEVVYECFENGGIPIEEVSGKEIGCYVGSLNGDYHDMQMRDPEQRMAGHAVGTGRAILSNRISHFFNLQGSSFTIDTACSSGLVGVDVACKNLRAGTLSGAVVAGVNLWLSPEHTEERGTMRAAYSASGKCHTFDAKADGYCRAEAVNAVYLKRLSDAVRDGDPIRALIRGTASNSDGWTPGINSPSSEAQAAMIREAYKNAGIDKNHYIETGYLECHGTGTPAGDPLEVKGAASVLAHMRPHTDPLIIGSVKSNIGHSEPGAGLSGLIKAMLAVEEGKIPGNPTFFNPNPAINFDDLRVHATRPGIAWPKESHHYRRASVNSFGFGGSNAHAILDNVDHYLAKHHTFPKLPKSHVSSFINLSDMLSLFDGLQSSKTVTQRPQVLVFSANDMDSLKRQIMTTSAHLLNPRVKVKLSDLSFTLSDRRSRHFCRAFLLGYPTKSGHASKLAIEDAQFSKTPQEEARIGFVFTGQGAQWSKMGAKLVETFPVTSKRVLEELDKALQELPLDIRPEWSLQEELTQARSSERLSQPEFSQPLVTALQLTQLAVLESWNVRAEGVVGHSSGEIAAACSAGFITPRQAILNAYFRGIAGKSVLSTSRKGMMAVGLSAKDVQSYIDDANVFKDDVVIACYNSPASVTISGSASSLAEVEDRVKAAGHFARILRVEVAYHSHHMTEIADRYEKLLIEHGGLEECGKVTPVSKYMISTVTENEVTGSEVCTAAYWKANMLSPVRFDGACTKMIKSNKLSPNFLLELGPSNTLAGPVTQIAKAAKTDQLTYAATNKRGEVDSCRAMFDVAGHLFLQNARFSLGKVNICEGSPNEVKPAVIVDLPNYQWKHSIQYWHESLASKDWRFKKFPAHDLLGSKVLGTLWQSPSWHRLLRLSDVPWLRDHQIGSEILFPAAGYITMAMEAVRQTALSTATTSEYDILKTKNYRYCLRDVQFPRGLVLEDDVEVHVMLLLVPMPKLGQEWWEFKITSLVESSSIASSSSPAPSPEKWKINSSGLVRLELNPGPAFSHATEDIFSLPLNNPTPGQMWYKSMKDAGYAYGPDFQKLVAVESMEGKSRSRSLISLTPPRTKWEPQSEYAVHPAPLDSVLQSMFTSLHRGNRSKLENVLVPRSIGEVTVSSHTWKSGEAVSVTTSSNASGDASLYDPVSGSLIMQLNGLSFTPLLDGRDSVYMSHTYTQLMWKPDFQHLDTDEKLRQAMLGDDNSKPHIQQILDLAAHKAPNLTVLEVNLVPGSTESLWFASDETPRPVRTALTEFHFASNNAENVLSAQERYAEWPAARASRYSVLDPFSKTFTMPAGSSKFDLVVIHWSQDNYSGSLETLAANLRRLISEGGNVVFYDSNLSSSTEDNQMNEGSPFYALQNLGLIKVRQTTSGSCIVAEVAPEEVPSPSNNNKIFVVRFSSAESTIMDDTISQLRAKGWDLDEIHINNQSDGKLSALAPESTVLVLDELARPLLATATGEEWSTVQTIIQRECNLVWVTQGSQITPTTPLNAVAHGVFRTVRAEVPMIRIITLDVESASPGNLGTNAIAINTALLEVNSPKERFIPIEREIVERGGLLYVSRVWPDAGVNKRKVEDNAGGPPSRLTNFHDSKSTISLVTSRPGSLDALHFAEQPKSQVIGPEEVEVELFASGCNARDVDGAMGSVHGDSGKLGLEGAGVVVRVGESVSTRHVGQRVAVFGNGCFSNRVIVSCKTTFTLPDNLSFEDAATLPVAFITGIYALRRLAPVQREDRVLVHSAFTSVGIACVRLCQSSGCDTFVTVSSLEQRQFLAQELALPEDHIFASESTTLLRALHNVTDGHGFDVIISQPMNGNLDYEDGRLLAPGGRLIKITNGGLDTGKLLSTGSLAANCSFQNLDIMALPHNTIESVFSELSQLTADGHLPPLSPITCLSYDEIPTALGLLREGLHIGKIVISDDLGASLAIPVQPAPTLPESILKPDHSYLFVGGLKGISGSLAIHLASNGAKHIAVMSRGGYEDKVSQHMARNIRALGCSLSLHQGDVTSIKDVRRVFSEILVPVGGIIQGAAVFRDRTFESMSHADYHAALACKVTGTSNLHSVSLETNQPITFFTMLSSISGVIGQKGQANYAGGNAFEDAFAAYRRASGLPAISINLGPIEDVGVISNNEDLQSRFDGSTLLGINEGLMRRIFDYSILQQHPDPHRRLNVTSQGQMITSLLLPQPEDSDLLQDIRFRGLRVLGGDGPRSRGDASKDKETQTLLFMIQSQDPDLAAVRTAAIVVVGSRLTKQLRLTDALDPARPLSYYGLDSLAAVELRNWVRITLGVEVTTLDVMNAASLGEFCDKVVGKMGVAM